MIKNENAKKIVISVLENREIPFKEYEKTTCGQQTYLECQVKTAKGLESVVIVIENGLVDFVFCGFGIDVEHKRLKIFETINAMQQKSFRGFKYHIDNNKVFLVSEIQHSEDYAVLGSQVDELLTLFPLVICFAREAFNFAISSEEDDECFAYLIDRYIEFWMNKTLEYIEYLRSKREN